MAAEAVVKVVVHAVERQIVAMERNGKQCGVVSKIQYNTFLNKY